MTMKIASSWTSIGERRRRRKPAMTGKILFSAWGHLRIVPIRTDTVAPHLCHQGRVPAYSRHATFHESPLWWTDPHISAILSC